MSEADRQRAERTELGEKLYAGKGTSEDAQKHRALGQELTRKSERPW